jgi:glyoxylase-like metal-dependent hydrolase (beta-lactamase superfamily II)
MNVREIAPGLHYWTAAHPAWNNATDWPEEVGCVCYETDTTAVLIDPLVPDADPDRAYALLDGWVEGCGGAAVLLTAPWHQRSAAAVAKRYDVTVWAHDSGRSRLAFETESGPLPDGVELFVPGGDAAEGQVAFYLPQPRALVVAEFFVGVHGGLELLLSPAEPDPAAFLESLRQLVELPIDHVLVAHGEPVVHSGRERIGEALGVG